MECNIKDRGKITSIKEFQIDDQTIVAIFQGARGDRPELDIIIKYTDKSSKGRVRTPKHIHWAIDLLIKKEHNEDLTKKFIIYLLDVWNNVQPFKTKKDQQNCTLIYSQPNQLRDYLDLNNYGEYSIQFISTILELIMIQEKTGSMKAHMFKDTLEAILNDKDIFSIVSRATYIG